MSEVIAELGEATLAGAPAIDQPLPIRRRPVRIGVVPALMLVVLIVAVGVAFLAGLAPYAPDAVDLAHRLTPPVQEGHLLGTDPLGRDILSRLMYGARISLSVAALAILIGGGVGTFLG
ncbi:MAG: ABC transporter permease, partial [Chloroflexota bacterium]|nr:ABC transporter permease [Chloroflexota bacterium]